MRYLSAIFIGAILGFSSLALHDSYHPYGLLLALVGSILGIWLLGRAWGLRRYKLLAALVLFSVVVRAATTGVGNELLIQGNSFGNLFFIGSFIAAILAIAIP
ncbi:MAG: hypothetical protein F2704_02405 [Actinobacteria bacterium]|uniref:Unannotated protein n=1 Tax=freshwater metagenome TaxID=449393 RepID=A0A6J7U4S1_9ZZZZ|nr:hypothetical protein [Actinomycetota bacterium]MSW47549.1 hypothetical protein [Actinomycetota bacterium]MSX24916.1 hypothetical protein [Actinomycetota bacterium]MSY46226.1 hypothetical protein [Actinomycetota bacterium]MSY57106.1 hypothetical protein [Actinomycetota bacterium]